MRFFLNVFLLCLINFSLNLTIGLAQNSIVIQPGPAEGKDAIVHTIFPGTNIGESQNIIAAAWTYQGEFGIIRAFFQFDFSDVPENLPIDSAHLSLYYNPTCGHEGHAGGNSSTIRKVVDPWQEGSIKWNNKPGTTDVNQVALGASITNNQNFLDIPVTSLVEDMISNPESNNGFSLKLNTEETYRSLTFASSDHADSLMWPKLEIFYSCLVDLGNDTTLCEGDTLMLATDPSYEYYLWNDDSTDSTLAVTTAGTYWVIVTDGFDCVASDTINIEFVPDPSTMLNLGSDTVLCSSDTLLLLINGNFSSYNWNDGSTDSTFLVTQSGNYYVTVSNDCGTATDSINVIISDDIIINLGNDTIVCSTDPFLLSVENNYSEYLWNNGSTDQTIEITTSGQYWIIVTNEHGCSAVDSIEVTIWPDLLSNYNIGEDTTICYGESITLYAGSGFDTYHWQNGSIDPEYFVYEPGIYYVTVSNQCGEISDSINITFYPEMEIKLGNDTTLCNGESMWITPGMGFQNYLWQDGSILNDLLINGDGLYSVEVTDYHNCVGEDEILITYLTVDVELGPDTSICENSEFELTTNNTYSGILWNDSIENEQLLISQPGFYWVEVFDSLDQKYCYDFDTIFIQYKEAPSLQNILNNYSICLGDSIVVSAPIANYFTYFWSTGSTENEITINLPGLYDITVLNECDTVFKSFVVSKFPEANPKIVADTINDGETIHLSLAEMYPSYLWSDGSNTPTIKVDHNGIFYVTVKNEFNCFGLDSITINPFDCITFIPNVFTPNYDYSNDLFFVDAANVVDFNIQIINRWGGQVFESTDKNFKWDGTSNGNQCADGTYYWIINYNCSQLSGDISQRILKGNLTLLR